MHCADCSIVRRSSIASCATPAASIVDDEELLRSAYHPDVVEDHGGYVGASTLIPLPRCNAHRPVLRATSATSPTHDVDIDGDEAHAESYWLCVLRRDEAGKLLLNGGRYVDRLERRERRMADREPGRRDRMERRHGRRGGPTVAPRSAPRLDRDDVSYERPLSVSRQPSEVSVTDPA